MKNAFLTVLDHILCDHRMVHLFNNICKKKINQKIKFFVLLYQIPIILPVNEIKNGVQKMSGVKTNLC